MIEEFKRNSDEILPLENQCIRMMNKGKDIKCAISDISNGGLYCNVFLPENIGEEYSSPYTLIANLGYLTLQELKDTICWYYSIVPGVHRYSAFTIAQVDRSYFGYGPLNFLHVIGDLHARWQKLREQQREVHHNEVACFVDVGEYGIFCMEMQPTKRISLDEEIVLEHVTVRVILPGIPYTDHYRDFFGKLNSMPGYYEKGHLSFDRDSVIREPFAPEGRITVHVHGSEYVSGIVGRWDKMNNAKEILFLSECDQVQWDIDYIVRSNNIISLRQQAFPIKFISLRGISKVQRRK